VDIGVKMNLTWDQIASELSGRISPDGFQRWFSRANLVEASENGVVIGLPNTMCQYWIEDNFLKELRESICIITGRPPMPVQFRVVECAAIEEKSETQRETKRSLPEILHDTDNAEAHSGLNPRYTFDTLVVGDSNRMAHAASVAVSDAPARTYNPLFFYGGVGLGKTHLSHAIGNALLQKKKRVRVCYVTSEQFTNDFIEALQKNTLTKFRKKYRMLDVLIIDDIQFLAGKEKSQEEFFHTFNSLFDGRKQIILTSDRPASEIANLQERLVSRFDWGLSAELLSPDPEMRLAILRKKLSGMDAEVSDEILEFLATRIKVNIRRLEGALLRVAAYTSLSGKSVSLQAVEHLLKDLLQEEARRAVTVDIIQKRVSDTYDLRPGDMTSKRRPANIALARQVAMYLCRKLTTHSLQNIGASFGGRDHGTVLHACKTVTSKISQDDRLRQTVQHLEQQLNNS